MMLRVGMGLLVILALTACGGEASSDAAACSDAEIARLGEQAQTGAWADYAAAFRTARDLPRADVPTAIDTLKRIRADVEREDWNGCGAEIEQHLLASIDANLAALQAFVANADAATVAHHYDEGLTEYQRANDLLTHLGDD